MDVQTTMIIQTIIDKNLAPVFERLFMIEEMIYAFNKKLEKIEHEIKRNE